MVGFAQWGETNRLWGDAGGLVERPEDGIIKHLYLNPESPEAGAIRAHRRGDPDVAFSSGSASSQSTAARAWVQSC
ncbi:MAG: hypothetical protein AB1331_08295 [Bacillota bacterium]